MRHGVGFTALEALEKLKAGNQKYLSAKHNESDVSVALRERTVTEGQNPYAVIVACSDSRVVPAHIFTAGIGDLFVIRVAGNVIGNHELGSIQYAVEHLSCPLVVVLGHTHCGAVHAALKGGAKGHTKYLTDCILAAIGEETDEDEACTQNVLAGVRKIRDAFSPDVPAIGAIYRTESGEVIFL